MRVSKQKSKARPESYSEWMARIDRTVEEAAAEIHKHPPAEKLLTGYQRRILEMIADHLRALPTLMAHEDPFDKPEYQHVKRILSILFETRYPMWLKRVNEDQRYIADIPCAEGKMFNELLRNCAGIAPSERVSMDKDED